MAYVEQGAVVVVCHREGSGDDGYYGSDRSSQVVVRTNHRLYTFARLVDNDRKAFILRS